MTTRRTFLKQAGTGALGLALAPTLLTRPVAPSDRLRIAHIGLNGMGNNHLGWFADLPDVDIVALCDVDQTHLDKTMARLGKLRPGTKVDGYADFRRILDRADVDVITCATPDHWHAQVAMLAFSAGKDVYGEKPLSFDIREGQQMLKSLNRHNRIFQLGTQIHATDNYHRVVELIQAGAIGDVHTVRLWKTGLPPVLGPAQYQKPPATLDWDRWLGPAPYHEYTPERCHFTYRYFLDYSGGVFQDFWSHIADVVWWALEPKGLKTVRAVGERPDGTGDAPKTIDIDYVFDGLKLHWTSRAPDVPGAAGRGIGAYFEGTKGTLLCDYNTREIRLGGEVLTDLPQVPKTLPRSPGHQRNFVDAVKARTQPESNLAYARRMTLPMHVGLIAYRVAPGETLDWHAGRERFRSHRAANDLVGRTYRKGWDWV
jgi:predicted dehydrogenase